jgi:hypothetical protein
MPFKVSKEELEEWRKNGYNGRVFTSKKEAEQWEAREKRKRPYRTDKECYEWLRKERPDIPPELASALVCMEFGGFPIHHLTDREREEYFIILEQKTNENGNKLIADEEKNKPEPNS